MKLLQILILLASITLHIGCNESSSTNEGSAISSVVQPDSVLRHIVVFKFKEDASTSAIEVVNKAFEDLQRSIPEIKEFEWGLNNSPEGLDQDFTHVYTVTFHSEEDRAIYLPHPEHMAFVESIGPVVEKAFVVDYWAK